MLPSKAKSLSIGWIDRSTKTHCHDCLHSKMQHAGTTESIHSPLHYLSKPPIASGFPRLESSSFARRGFSFPFRGLFDVSGLETIVARCGRLRCDGCGVTSVVYLGIFQWTGVLLLHSTVTFVVVKRPFFGVVAVVVFVWIFLWA